MKTAKSRVASLLQVFSPKKKAAPEQPSATQEGMVRPQEQGRPAKQPATTATGPDKGALFLDAAGKIVSVQPRCASFFGRLPEELIRHHLKDFLKPPCDQEFTNALEKGKQTGALWFPAVALRKDGSEFSTQLALKFLSGNHGFCWTVFVQAPPGHSYHEPLNARSGSKPSRELKPTVATTETATQGETPEMESAEEPAAPAAADFRLPASTPRGQGGHTSHVRREAAEPRAHGQTEFHSLRTRAEENETARNLLVADLERVRDSNKLLRKKEGELNAQLQQLQTAVEQAEARARESAAQSSDWEKKAAEFRNEIDELTRAQIEGRSPDTQFAIKRVKELEQQLKDANTRVAAAKTQAEKLQTENRQLNEANTRTRADLDEERDANKLAQQMAEELHAQVRKLQNTAHSRPPAQSDAPRKQGHTAHIKRLEKDLLAARAQNEKFAKQAQDSSAGSKAQSQKGEPAAKLEQELQSLRTSAEENEAARKLLVTDLERVRDSNKLLRKKEGELNAQLQKLQTAVEQAEVRARESAAQSSDWEKKAADFRKEIDELTRAQTSGQGADTQFATRRLAELEQQLKDANASVAAAKTQAEKLEAENRQLTEASTTTRAELDEERDATKMARQVAKELNAQVRKLQEAADLAEVRARESAVQSKDWEKQAAELKKTVDELTRSHAAGNNTGTQAAQPGTQSTPHIQELEQQLKDAKAELDEERGAAKMARQIAKELNAQLRKLQDAADQAEARARQSAAQSGDWEKKAADLKKSVDELTHSPATGNNADAQSAQRVKELEQQLNEANDNAASARKEAEKQSSARQRLETDIRNLAETYAKAKADLDKERGAKNLPQKEREGSNAQVQKLQAAVEQAEARARESAAQSKDWETKAADLKKSVDELTHSHAAGKNADAQSARRVKEVEQQLNEANANLAAAKKQVEKLEAEIRNLAETSTKVKADFEQERDAKNLSQKEKEELNAQVQKLKSAAEQADARARESAAQSKDWEKKAADLKTSVDELTRNHTAEKNAAAQSAERVAELEQQLQDANANAVAAITQAEKLEAKIRTLAETSAKAKHDLEQERDAKNLSQKENEELNAQVQKLKSAAEQADARARENAAQSKDWEKKAADLKTSVDELTRNHTAEKNAAAQSAHRIKELEQQLKDANSNVAAAKTQAEKLEAQNRQLNEANTRTRADHGEERNTKKFSQKEREELNAQLQKLKSAAEQAEARALESAAQSKDWEKKAADLKTSLDELTRSLAAEKNAAAQSAQRVKELEQQLKDANAAAAKSQAEKPEAESRQLNEANTREALDEERDATELARKLADELNIQIRKMQDAAEQAEARAHESATQSRDWEKKAAALKRCVGELTRNYGGSNNADTQSAQRIRELEQQVKDANFAQRIRELELQLKDANAGVIAAKTQAVKLEPENRQPKEARTIVKPDLVQPAGKQAVLEKKVDELEKPVREAVFTVEKVDAELESQGAERGQPRKTAPPAAPQLERLKERPETETLEDFVEALKSQGYIACEDGTPEKGIEKIVIYMKNGHPTRAAWQLESGHWTNKFGILEDAHPETLHHGKKAHIFMQRRRNGRPFLKDRGIFKLFKRAGAG